MRDWAEACLHLIEQPDHIRLDDHIALTGYGGGALGAALGHHLLGSLSFGPVRDRDVIAAGSRKLRDRSPYAAASTCNEYDRALSGHSSIFQNEEFRLGGPAGSVNWAIPVTFRTDETV
jgi:hypothetical protein